METGCALLPSPLPGRPGTELALGLPLAEMQAEPAQSSCFPVPLLPQLPIWGKRSSWAPLQMKDSKGHVKKPLHAWLPTASAPCRPASCLARQEMDLRVGRPGRGGVLILSVCWRSLPTTSEHSESAGATHSACLQGAHGT